MKNIIDLTVPLGPKALVYPGDPIPKVTLLSSRSNGDLVTTSNLDMCMHIGTHVDLPGHFIDGAKLLGDYSVDAFTGHACVLDLTNAMTSIKKEDLTGRDIPRRQHVLLKTRNSKFLRDALFTENYVYLEPEAAALIIQSDPLSIGIDYYSLDPADTESLPAHRICAEYGIPVFVCLDMASVTAGSYWFAGLPLNYPTLEGAPVRAIIWDI
ncbi:MAG: cyclase family protein [Sneathiella sp.]|nr:cyclase family protein [Sneathiella sp.]